MLLRKHLMMNWARLMNEDTWLVTLGLYETVEIILSPAPFKDVLNLIVSVMMHKHFWGLK